MSTNGRKQKDKCEELDLAITQGDDARREVERSTKKVRRLMKMGELEITEEDVADACDDRYMY